MKRITTDDGLFTRVVPELQDLAEFRTWHMSGGNEEPTFILHPRTFTDFAATLGRYEGTFHPELGEGLMTYAVGIQATFKVFPDSSVDEGGIDVIRERF